MANYVLIAEAVEQSMYTHEHIAWLLRHGKVAGRKAGGTWMVDLDDLKRYEERKESPPRKKRSQ